MDRNAWLTASAIVLDKIEGKTGAAERIEAVSRPRGAKRVALDLSAIPVGLPLPLASR